MAILEIGVPSARLAVSSLRLCTLTQCAIHDLASKSESLRLFAQDERNARDPNALICTCIMYVDDSCRV